MNSIDKKHDKSNLPEYLFHQGTNYSSYLYMGAHFENRDGKNGVVFRTWAPNAEKVSVVGDFNKWDANVNQMIRISNGGIYELFIPNLKEFDIYKFAISNNGKTILKADPYAFYSEVPSGTASKVYNLDGYVWNDSEYISHKTTLYDKPINVYEVNLGSWKKHADGGYYSYIELSEELVSYCKEMGYTHIEIMPISEFPFDGSWGYQVTGYYSVTSRFGTPKDFMAFIDRCHQNGIGVILDWVPAHFPKDAHGLMEFDGTCCYENQGWDRKENKTWGTRIFDWGRNEVQSFLISNAIFFHDYFHIDGLRVDAVSSMLYLDYDRNDGEWIPNQNGGNYNLEAISFLKKLNSCVFERFPYTLMIAEESTSFPNITKPTYLGGLGFNFKWNMGWMNDVLSYVILDPYFKGSNHNKLTFSMCYAFSENYILPISHDEVVHGKKSLLDKMPGDVYDKFSNIRAFNAYMFAHPGKKLTFMGSEYGQFKEWNYKEGIEFFMLKFPLHRKLLTFNKELNKIYKEFSSFYQIEDSWDGFEWISPNESNNSIISFIRKNNMGDNIVVIINFSGINFDNYHLGLDKGKYKVLLNTDSLRFGGSGLNKKRIYTTKKISAHGKNNSISIKLPKFSGIYLIKQNNGSKENNL